MLAGQWRSRKPWPVDGHVWRTLQDAAMFSGLQGYHTLLFLSSLYSPLPLSSPSRSDSSTDASSCEKPRFTSLLLLSFFFCLFPPLPCQPRHTKRQKSKEEKRARGKTFVAEACFYKFAPIKGVKLQTERAKRICACVSACERAPVCVWEGRNLGWSLIYASSSGNKHFWGWSSEERGIYVPLFSGGFRQGGREGSGMWCSTLTLPLFLSPSHKSEIWMAEPVRRQGEESERRREIERGEAEGEEREGE